MKKSLAVIVVLLHVLLMHTHSGLAQQVFFKSSQSYNQDQLERFYASIQVQDGLLLFNAPDYKLYAYDREGELKWNYYLGMKSNNAPFFVNGSVWANGRDGVVQLDLANGKLVKELPLESLETAPVVKDNMLYGTGLLNGGMLFAYDLKGDSVAWKRFLAHGVSVRPHFLADVIVANAEGDNWLEVNYTGQLTAPGCETGEEAYPSELPCVKTFAALSHDGKEIKGKLAKKIGISGYDIPSVSYGPNRTFILNEETLFILGNKLKVRARVSLASLPGAEEISGPDTPKILKSDEEHVWVLFANHLFVYNHQKDKLTRATDLSTWNPHQALVDQNRLWLISKNDGLLYGLQMN